MDNPECEKRKLDIDDEGHSADKKLKKEVSDPEDVSQRPSGTTAEVAASGQLKNECSDMPGKDMSAPTSQTDVTLDSLSYTRGEDFTSEIYKIQIHNLPRFFGFSQLKKRMKTTLKLNPHKIKCPDNNVAYVCFRNESDREDAIEKIHGHMWKGKSLEAKIAAPAADPYMERHKKEKNGQDEKSKSRKSVPVENLTLTPEEAEERLKASVIPLWNTEYQEQLQLKTERVKSVLIKVAGHSFVKHMFKSSSHDKTACPLDPIVPSPVTSEYRNKNEFTIGYGLDKETVTVGFRYGMYRDGTTSVGDCTNLKVAMPAALPVVQSFTSFLRSSKFTPFQQQTNTGHWHTLTVRTYRSGDVLAMVDFVPRTQEQEDAEEAKSSIKNFYTTGEGSHIKITSFYFRIIGSKGHGSKKTELVFGEQAVHEDLLGLKFRISPEAFFQVNSLATEKLYDLIGEWSGASASTTLLDVCCGTGTIGLSLARKVQSVFGIEMCKEAVDDANANAALNGITNARFICSKVEDVIASTLSSLPSREDVIAIVDPPRAGLHKNVIKALRKHEEIETLVYVSCNPDSVVENFVDLIREETGKHKGSPFTMKKAVPVDLFPGTRHCELLILFQRGTKLEQPSGEDQSKADVKIEETNLKRTIP